MKKDFRTRITRLAEEIAGIEKKVDTKDGNTLEDKLEPLKSSLSSALSAINSDAEFADVILYMKSVMPKLSDTAAKAGIRLAKSVMDSSKPVSKDAPGAMYDKMPVPDSLRDKDKSVPDAPELPELK